MKLELVVIISFWGVNALSKLLIIEVFSDLNLNDLANSILDYGRFRYL